MSNKDKGYEVFVGKDRSYAICAPTRRAAVVEAALYEYRSRCIKAGRILPSVNDVVEASTKYKVVREK